MPKPVTWTPELVTRFWDGFAQVESMKALSFGRLAGALVVELASLWVAKGTRCLDYGGGDGQLVQHLIEAGIPSAAFEPSSLRAREIEKAIGDSPLFLGRIEADDPCSFGFILCTEVIEHVLPGGLDEFAQAIVRRLEPGGKVLLSTPYAEDLSQAAVYCPVCDSTFHRWQHQRSFRPGDLRALFERHGLRTEWIGLVGFDEPNAIRDFVLRYRLGEPWPAYHEESAAERLPIVGRGDHIVYVGCKSTRAGNAGELAGRSRQEVLVNQGVAATVQLGGRPLVLVPKEEIDDARALNIDAEVRALEEECWRGEPDRVAVLPAPMCDFVRAVEAGQVSPLAPAVVLEQDRWLQLLPSVRHRRRLGSPVQPSVGARWITRTHEQIGRVIRMIPLARRLQPLVDRRERYVLDTLLHPWDFPLRLSHVVRRRVLFAIGTLGSGGAERQLINTAEGLARRGVDDIHILVNHLHDDQAHAFYLSKAKAVSAGVYESAPVDLSQLPWVAGDPALRRAVGDGILARILGDAKIIHEVAPEVVHASLDWTNVTVGIAAVLAGVPHVFLSGRNLSPLYFPFFQWFMYPCYRALTQCSGVQLLNNSEAGRQDYAAWLRIDSRRIKVIRNGLQTKDFPAVGPVDRSAARAKLGLSLSAKVIVGAFRLSAEKRPLLWVDTAAKIRAVHREAIFLICGVGPELEAMKRRVRQRRLDDAVQFLGARGDIGVILAAADLVLQTSLQEGTPNVLIEAQASGVPVVTTPAYGAAEAVEDGVTGFVVAASTAEPLARAALRVLANPGFAATVRTAGPRFIESRFGYERMIDDTLELYAEAGASWAAQLLPQSRRFCAYEELRNMYQESGCAWIVRLPHLAGFADTASAPTRSRLVVLEDGQPLGPAHTAHDVIRQQGAGAYSHWNDVLYFSTSDGSDPRTNGRSYVAFIPRGSGTN